MSRQSIVSCRVRLARNLAGTAFPHMMSHAAREKLIGELGALFGSAAGGHAFTDLRLDDGNRTAARALMERHLISPEFAGEDAPHAVVLSEDGSISVMLCEEDHLRIQVFGDHLEPCCQKAGRLEDLVDEKFPLAFDEKLGYLTACPTNLGSGLRASALMHLPGLSETGAIRGLIHQAAAGGLTVRGFYGEGTQAAWGYYQISNAVTLGLCEQEIISALTDITGQISAAEEKAREKIRKDDPAGFEDRVWRAFGILRNARRVTTKEAMEHLSVLRMAASFGVPPHVTIEKIDGLSRDIWPCTLQENQKPPGYENARDEARAALLRKELGGLNHEQ